MRAINRLALIGVVACQLTLIATTSNAILNSTSTTVNSNATQINNNNNNNEDDNLTNSETTSNNNDSTDEPQADQNFNTSNDDNVVDKLRVAKDLLDSKLAPNFANLRCNYKNATYADGARVPIAGQPCLTCTCRQSLLQCFLRVCPTTTATASATRNGNCKLVKEPTTCCPVLRCFNVTDVDYSLTERAAQASRPSSSSNEENNNNNNNSNNSDNEDNDDNKPQTTTQLPPTSAISTSSSQSLADATTSATTSNDATTKLTTTTATSTVQTNDATIDKKQARDSVLLISSMPQQSLTHNSNSKASNNFNSFTNKTLQHHHDSLDSQQSISQLSQQSTAEYSLMMDALIDAIYARATQLSGLSNLHGSCLVNNSVYVEGSAIISSDLSAHSSSLSSSSSSSSNSCQYCYCIRQKVMCVRPKCHLSISGCTARYNSEFACCPTSYECKQPMRQTIINATNNAHVASTLESMARLTASSDLASRGSSAAADDELSARHAPLQQSTHNAMSATSGAVNVDGNIYGALSQLVKNFASSPQPTTLIASGSSTSTSSTGTQLQTTTTSMADINGNESLVRKQQQRANDSSSSSSHSESSFLEPMHRFGPLVSQPDWPTSCSENGRQYEIGEQIPTIEKCRHCYCALTGVKECKIIECNLKQAIDSSCTPIVPDGHCCPVKYLCANGGDIGGSDATLVSVAGNNVASRKFRLEDDALALHSLTTSVGSDETSSSGSSSSGSVARIDGFERGLSQRAIDNATEVDERQQQSSPLAPSTNAQTTQPMLNNVGIASIEPVYVTTISSALDEPPQTTTTTTPTTTTTTTRTTTPTTTRTRTGSGSSFDYASIELAASRDKQRDSRSAEERRRLTDLNFAHHNRNHQHSSTRRQQQFGEIQTVAPPTSELRTLDFYMNPIDQASNNSSIADSTHSSRELTMTTLTDSNIAANRFRYDAANAAVADAAVFENNNNNSSSTVAPTSGELPNTTTSATIVAVDFDDEFAASASAAQKRRQQHSSTSSLSNFSSSTAILENDAIENNDSTNERLTSSNSHAVVSKTTLAPNATTASGGWVRSLSNFARSFGRRLVRPPASSSNLGLPATAHRATPAHHHQHHHSHEQAKQRSLDLTGQQSAPASVDSHISSLLGDFIQDFIAQSLAQSATTPTKAPTTTTPPTAPTLTMARISHVASLPQPQALTLHNQQQQQQQQQYQRNFVSNFKPNSNLHAKLVFEPSEFDELVNSRASNDAIEIVTAPSSLHADYARANNGHEPDDGFGARAFARRSDAPVAAHSSPVVQPLQSLNVVQQFTPQASNAITTPTTTMKTTSASNANCFDAATRRVYKQNERIPKDDPCKTCVCLLGIEMCQPLVCPPKPESENCRAEFTRGQCCASYVCGPQAQVQQAQPSELQAPQHLQFGARSISSSNSNSNNIESAISRRVIKASQSGVVRPPLLSSSSSSQAAVNLPSHLRFRPYAESAGSANQLTSDTNSNSNQKNPRIVFSDNINKLNVNTDNSKQQNLRPSTHTKLWPGGTNMLAPPATRFSAPAGALFKPLSVTSNQFDAHSPVATPSASAPPSLPTTTTNSERLFVNSADSAQVWREQQQQQHLGGQFDSPRLSLPSPVGAATVAESSNRQSSSVTKQQQQQHSQSSSTLANNNNNNVVDELNAASTTTQPVSSAPINELFKVSECDAFGKTFKLGEQIKELSVGNGCKKCTCTANGVECSLVC